MKGNSWSENKTRESGERNRIHLLLILHKIAASWYLGSCFCKTSGFQCSGWGFPGDATWIRSLCMYCFPLSETFAFCGRWLTVATNAVVCACTQLLQSRGSLICRLQRNACKRHPSACWSLLFFPRLSGSTSVTSNITLDFLWNRNMWYLVYTLETLSSALYRWEAGMELDLDGWNDSQAVPRRMVGRWNGCVKLTLPVEK